MIKHPIEPVFNADSKILILGSFPSVKSRQQMFFYGHPQNRFWRVLSAIFNEDVPMTIEEKKELLLRNHIALWDVVASCEIAGSSDSSIKNVVANDLNVILDVCSIEKIYCNGNKAYELYNRHLEKDLGRSAIRLPSTSPANAAMGFDELFIKWRDMII